MLNNYLNYEKLIINASTDGKTTKGYVNDFIHWFPKLENFSPEYAIFYIGINDSNFNQDSKFDIPWREDYLSRTKDYIKHTQPISETTDCDDVYILRSLIEKVNELVEEVNTLKNQYCQVLLLDQMRQSLQEIGVYKMN